MFKRFKKLDIIGKKYIFFVKSMNGLSIMGIFGFVDIRVIGCELIMA